MRGRHWPYVAVLLLLTGCEEAAKKPPMEPPPDDTPRPPAGKPTDSKPAHEATRVTLDTNLEWSSADSSTSYVVYFGTDPTPDGADAGYLPRGPGCALRARSGAARHDRGCPPWDRRIRRLGAPWRWRRGQRKSWPARRLRRAGLPGSRRRRPSAATPPTPTGKPFPQGENVAAPTAADLFALSRVAGVHSVAVMVPCSPVFCALMLLTVIEHRWGYASWRVEVLNTLDGRFSAVHIAQPAFSPVQSSGLSGPSPASRIHPRLERPISSAPDTPATSGRPRCRRCAAT